MPHAREPEATLVVPCFNEAKRFDAAKFASLAHTPALRLLFVDDGSKDDTRAVLDAFAKAHPGRAFVLALAKNGGKGEAVRAGMREAIARGATIVGYADADLATPPEELVRLRDELVHSDALAVTAARVALLGRDIRRSERRHYLGRIFATAASTVLRTRYYDTQCGAKYFRVGPAIEAALASPFLSRWAFDVELLGRLLAGGDGAAPVRPSAIVEVPLHRWADVGGSKLATGSMVKAAIDLARIEIELRRRRRKT